MGGRREAQEMSSTILFCPMGVARLCSHHQDKELLREDIWGYSRPLLSPYLPPAVSFPEISCLGWSQEGEDN